jgi:nitrilase
VRAVENQVVWVSSNLTGRIGPLRFVGHAKVVGPDGRVVASTGARRGMAAGPVDVATSLTRARTAISHLGDRVLGSYAEAAVTAMG